MPVSQSTTLGVFRRMFKRYRAPSMKRKTVIWGSSSSSCTLDVVNFSTAFFRMPSLKKEFSGISSYVRIHVGPASLLIFALHNARCIQ